MGIEQQNIYELIDASFDQLEEQFTILSDKIRGKVKKLGYFTGIGSNNKFGNDAVAWNDIK